MSTAASLPIGELAAATGVAVSALRHYDELHIITPVGRVGGKRRFAMDAIGRVNFIRRAQRFGFSLTEIRDMLDDTSGASQQLARDKIDVLRAQQAELATMIEILEEVVECGCQVVAECPRMDTCC